MNADLNHLTDKVVAARLSYLTQLAVKANDRARAAGVEVADLPTYIKGLQDLNLLDGGERLTVDGAVYVNIGLRKGTVRSPLLNRLGLWRRVGGDEPRLQAAINNLMGRKLIKSSSEGFSLVQAS